MSSKYGPLVGAIDEGTSSARFLIFSSKTSEVVVSHQVETFNIYPQEGWVEQDPKMIMNAVTQCVERAVEALEAKGIPSSDVVAVGVTNQRETTIAWDTVTGEPLHNAIVWLDTRTTETVTRLAAEKGGKVADRERWRRRCGLPFSPYFSGFKMRWLLDNCEAVQRSAREGTCVFGTVDSWIIWNLTGGKEGGLHMTDVSNASRTMLMNLDTLQWDPELLKFFDIDEKILPKIYSSSEIYGSIASGPLKGVPISGCLGDQHAALVGQRCVQRGMAKSTYGTGCFLLYNTENQKVMSSHGLLTTVAYQLGRDTPPAYAVEGSVAVAGAALRWLRDNVPLLDDVAHTEAIADAVVSTEDVYFVPAFSGLYAPYWQPDARGVICGLSEDSGRAHVVRAALEAICFQTRDLLEAMAADCGTMLTQLRVDGGMTRNSLLMQLQADLVGVTVLRPQMAETTSLGVAIAAGSADGVAVWDVDAIQPVPCDEFKPRTTQAERDARYSRWKMAVERSLGWSVS